MTSVQFPAKFPGVIAVASTDKDGRHSATSVTGSELVVSAPGEKLSTANVHGGYSLVTGTSDATAIVSGVVALIRSKMPSLTATEVFDRIVQTALDKGVAGRDPIYGFGIINPLGALTKIESLHATVATDDEMSLNPSAPGSAASSTARWSIILLVLIGGMAIVLLVVGLSRR
jgi:subtilisin family serine protease